MTTDDRVKLQFDDGTEVLLWNHDAALVDPYSVPASLKSALVSAEPMAVQLLLQQGWSHEEIDKARRLGLVIVERDCDLEVGTYLRCKLVSAFTVGNVLGIWWSESPVCTAIPITLEKDQSQEG